MLIANPIYDAVFKYLMEDERVARIVISTIIDEDIEELRFTPRERTARIPSLGVTVFRLDFSAVIRTPDGARKNVLIELQKADGGDDVRRFRRYLAENYFAQSADAPKEDMEPLAPVVPIISVYILGEPLSGLRGYSAVKIKRHYYDAVTGARIESRDPFVECLTHDSFVVQLSELNQRRRNRLEQLLALFEQMNLKHNRHLKEFTDTLPDEFEPALNRLLKAAVDREILAEMEVEDDVLVAWKKKERAFEEQVKEARETAEAERRQKEQARKKAAEARKKEAEARKKETEARKKEAEARKKEAEARQREERIRQVALKALLATGMSEEEAVLKLAGEN